MHERWWNAFAGAWTADWRERSRDRRVALVLALGIVLALFAGGQGAIEAARRDDARTQANHAERERWLHQSARHPHAAAHQGVYVFRPEAPLAALDPGISPHVGAGTWLEAHKQNEMLQRPAVVDPGELRGTDLTPAFVLRVVAPLAIVLLGFGVLAGERERGTLAALRMSGAPLSAIAAARGAVLLCLALAVALPCCIGMLAWMPSSAAVVDGLPRAVAFIGAYALYLLFWCVAVVGLSAWAKTLASSLSLALGLWVGCTLVLPRLAMEAAAGAASLPRQQAFREALDDALDSPQAELAEARAREAVLKRYGVADLKQLPFNWEGLRRQAGEDRGNAIFDAHYGALFDALRAQDDAANRFGWLSPGIAVAQLSGAAAAGDTAHHLQFVHAAEGQRRLIQRTLNIALRSTTVGDEALWARVPAFAFRYAPLPASMAWLRLPLALAVAVVLAAWALRRLARGGLR